MVQYRRNLLPGGTYFFTQTLQDRCADYLTQHIDLLRMAMKKTQQQAPFKIVAIVVLPEHMHTIWTLPENDNQYANRWRLIKSYFTQSLCMRHTPKIYKNKRGEYNLWQTRYWEHTIRNEHDLNNHIDYIHYNPVKHGLVKNPIDWPYSSLHSYIKKDILPPHWGENVRFPVMNFGE